MDGPEQEVNAAVDNLFAESTPETESQETSSAETATTGEQTQTEQGQSQEGQGEGQAEQFFAEVAGRKYPTKEDFVRSHETLLQKLQRQEQDSRSYKQTHDRWGKWDKFMSENPKFYDQVKLAEQRYLEAKKAGATNAEAKQVAQNPNATLPPEVKKKLEMVDRLEADYMERQQERSDGQLQKELDTVKSTFKLDDAIMKKVTGRMLKVAEDTGLAVSAEWAYRDLRASEANAELLKTQVELKRVRGSDTAPSSPNAPAPKRKIVTKKDEDDEINAWLSKMGVQEAD